MSKKMVKSIIGLFVLMIFLFPIYWMIISSVKTTGEIFLNKPTFFPKEISFEYYINIFSKETSIVKYLINSFIIASSSMFLTIALGIPAAYGISRKKMWIGPIFLYIVLMIQMVPSNAVALPLFTMFSKLGLIDTYLGVIIANVTISLPFVIIVMRPFFVNIPKSLEESAYIDGCSKWETFFKIMIPLTKPGLVTCAAFGFIFAWGEFLYSLILLTNSKYWPITVGMKTFMGQYGTQWGELMAIATVSSIPIILIFIMTQKHIVGGITSGAVKG